MADIQEKEELTDQEEIKAPETDSKGEESVEDYFNPFAEAPEPTEEDKEIEEDIKEEKKVEEVSPDVKSELAEIKALNTATREVGKFVKEHPEFGDMSDDLIDLASKAGARGHSKPVEFAVRNVKSPSYWIDYGKNMAKQDIGEVAQNRVGGASMPKRDGGGTPDFKSMSIAEFNEYSRSISSNS